MFNWMVHLDYGEGDTELAYGSSASVDEALSAAYGRIADDALHTLVSSQNELKRVAAGYTPPPREPYRSLIEDAVNEHQAPYPHHHAGIEYLRMAAAETDAESVVEDNLTFTADQVRGMATTDSKSSTSVQQTVYLHEEWEYHIRVDAAS